MNVLDIRRPYMTGTCIYFPKSTLYLSVSIMQTRASNNIGIVVPKINKTFTNYDAFYKAYILY